MIVRITTFALLALLLASCCSPCRKYRQTVRLGLVSEPEAVAELEPKLYPYPERFKANLRILLRRGSRESAFSMLLKVNRPEETMRVAVLSDLGSVMLTATWDIRSGVVIQKNTSGWSDDTVRETLIRDLVRIFFPEIPPNHAVRRAQDRVSVLAFSAKDDKEMFVFDRHSGRPLAYHQKTLRFFGEFEQDYQIEWQDWKTLKPWERAIPVLAVIDDAANSYRARVAVRSITPQ